MWYNKTESFFAEIKQPKQIIYALDEQNDGLKFEKNNNIKFMYFDIKEI